MPYLIAYHINYEGSSIVEVDTMDEVLHWISDHDDNSSFDIRDIDVIETVKDLDVSELILRSREYKVKKQIAAKERELEALRNTLTGEIDVLKTTLAGK